MKKGIFYITSLILTIAVAISARAVAFSSDSFESTPETKTVRISTLEHEKPVEIPDLRTGFVTANNPQTQVQKSTNQETTAKQTEEIPVFRVTDYISVCDNVNCFTSKDAERGVVQFQDTFFYGHSTIAFDRLKTVYVGQKIKVVDINGVSHTYQIMQRMVKTKSYLNGDGKTDGFTGGIYSGRYNGTQYSAAFMTCGNGSNNDSNYRLILFATEV